MITPRNYPCIVQVGNGVYVIGGYQSPNDPAVEYYHYFLDTWTTKSSLLRAIISSTAALVGRTIYTIGGLYYNPSSG
jgi:hypothetical protein